MGRSPGFGSVTRDYSALFRLGFPSAAYLSVLNLATYNNSPDRSTKSTPSGLNALRLLVNTGFQVLFHSPPGVLFTFPSRYCFTIGRQFVFSLGRWSSLLPTGFHVPRGTLDSGRSHLPFAYGTITLFGLDFPVPHSARLISLPPVRNPVTRRATQLVFAALRAAARFGLIRVRSPLLAESLLFSSPVGT